MGSQRWISTDKTLVWKKIQKERSASNGTCHMEGTQSLCVMSTPAATSSPQYKRRAVQNSWFGPEDVIVDKTLFFFILVRRCLKIKLPFLKGCFWVSSTLTAATRLSTGPLVCLALKAAPVSRVIKAFHFTVMLHSILKVLLSFFLWLFLTDDVNLVSFGLCSLSLDTLTFS